MSRDSERCIYRIERRQARRCTYPLPAQLIREAENVGERIEAAVNVSGRSWTRLSVACVPQGGQPVCANPGSFLSEGVAYRRPTEVERHSVEITFLMPDVLVDFRLPDVFAVTAAHFRGVAEQVLEAAARVDAIGKAVPR